MKYNGIDDSTLKAGVDNFGYIKIEKGEYVFKEGDSSKRFFGIIKGKISIRVKKKEQSEKKLSQHNVNDMYSYSSLSPVKMSAYSFLSKRSESNQRDNNSPLFKLQSRNELYNSIVESQAKNSKAKQSDKGGMAKLAMRTSLLKRFYGNLHDKVGENEEEIILLTEGMCFGEWALLYNAPRKASAYAAEETHLFFLDKESFDISFSKSLFKAETERKAFLCNTIPLFKKLPKHKFDEYYRKFVAQFFKRNDIIYRESDKADCLYILFQGECHLKRNITKPYKFLKSFNVNNKVIEECGNENNKEDKSAIPNYNFDAKYLREVEHILKDKDYHNILKLQKGDIGGLEITAGLDKLNHTLVSASDHTVILKIHLTHLGQHRAQICSDLLPLYIEKEDIIENYVKSHRNIQKKMKIHYRTFSANQFGKKVGSVNQNVVTEDEELEKEKEKEREMKVKLLINKIQSNRPQSKSHFKSLTIEHNRTLSNMASIKNSTIETDRAQVKVYKNPTKERLKTGLHRKKLSVTDKIMKTMQTMRTMKSNNLSPVTEKKTTQKLFLTEKENFSLAKNEETKTDSQIKSAKQMLFPFSEKKDKKTISIFKPIIFKNVKVVNKKEILSKTVFTYNSGIFDLPMVSLNETGRITYNNSKFNSPNNSVMDCQTKK